MGEGWHPVRVCTFGLLVARGCAPSVGGEGEAVHRLGLGRAGWDHPL